MFRRPMLTFPEPSGAVAAARLPPGRRPGSPWAAPCAPFVRCVTIREVAEPVSASDQELLQRIATRDESALAALYDQHSALAYGVILRILRSPSDAEDVLQETFVRVWSRAESYDPRLGTAAAWLVRIARNRAIDRLRARAVRKDLAVEPAIGRDGEPAPPPEPATHETPETVVHGAATTRALRAAMALLPEGQRALIDAAFFEGYTHPELAARFGVPLGTVKTRIRTGLMAMRGRLEQVI